MKKQKYRYQTQTITLAIGVSGVNETNITLDNQFEKAVGYGVYSRVQNAADFFNFGLRNAKGVIHDRTYQDDHISTTAVPHKDRYKEIDLEAKGNVIIAQVEPIAALVGALTIDVVFKLIAEDC